MINVHRIFDFMYIFYCLRQQGSGVLGLQSLIAMSGQVLITS